MTMKRILQQKALFIIFTPLFFVLHIALGNFFYVSLTDILIASFGYLLISAVAFVFLSFFFRKKQKALVLLFAFQLIFFFFSSFHTLLRTLTNNGSISRYSFLLPFLTLLLLLFIFWLIKTKTEFSKLYQSLNSVLFFLIIAEFFIIISNKFFASKIKFESNQDQVQIMIPDSLKRNCYFIIFDAYANSSYLKKRFGYTNPLDSSLIKSGFYVYPKSNSNYNFTHFSIASALNFSYFNGLKYDSITREDYTNALKVIKENKIVPIFESNGFEFINLSIFDIEHHPAIISSSYLPKGISLFNRFTFFSHVMEDIGWHLFNPKNPKLEYFFYYKLNQLKKSNSIIDENIELSLRSPSQKPKFVYAHYNMPHPPYFFDSTGKERPISIVYREQRGEISRESNYLPHLVYTNKKMLEIVSKIMTAENGNAVIIIAGDHGNREKNTRNEMFENYIAIYTPEQYRNNLKKDSITLINILPNILNAVYNQNVQFSADSLFFLKDAAGVKDR